MNRHHCPLGKELTHILQKPVLQAEKKKEWVMPRKEMTSE